VAAGDLARVEQLLARGADPNAAGADGIEPLFVAAAGGHPALARFRIAPFEIAAAAIARALPEAGDAGAGGRASARPASAIPRDREPTPGP